MNTEKNSCKNCYFCVESELSECDLHGQIRKKPFLECRRYPPQTREKIHTGRSPITCMPIYKFTGGFPIVTESDFCGEFKKII